jgi:chromosome segregation ATPase
MEAAQSEASALRDSLARCTADLEESNRHAMVLSEELEAGREMEKGWKADVGRLEEEIRALKSKVAISRDDADSKDREMEAERQKFKDLVAVGGNVSLHVC